MFKQIKILFIKLRKKFHRFLTMHINSPVGLVSTEDFLLSLQMATCMPALHMVVPLCMHAAGVSPYVLISSFYKSTMHTELGPSLMASPEPNYHFEGVIPKYNYL